MLQAASHIRFFYNQDIFRPDDLTRPDGSHAAGQAPSDDPHIGLYQLLFEPYFLTS
jgi:hypothetical protein